MAIQHDTNPRQLRGRRRIHFNGQGETVRAKPRINDRDSYNGRSTNPRWKSGDIARQHTPVESRNLVLGAVAAAAVVGGGLAALNALGVELEDDPGRAPIYTEEPAHPEQFGQGAYGTDSTYTQMIEQGTVDIVAPQQLSQE